MEALVEDNDDLRIQLTEMIAVFEQYLKVATLKESAERMQDKVDDEG